MINVVTSSEQQQHKSEGIKKRHQTAQCLADKTRSLTNDKLFSIEARIQITGEDMNKVNYPSPSGSVRSEY